MNPQHQVSPRVTCRRCGAPGCVFDEETLFCGDCFYEQALRRRAMRSAWFARRRHRRDVQDVQFASAHG